MASTEMESFKIISKLVLDCYRKKRSLKSRFFSSSGQMQFSRAPLLYFYASQDAWEQAWGSLWHTGAHRTLWTRKNLFSKKYMKVMSRSNKYNDSFFTQTLSSSVQTEVLSHSCPRRCLICSRTLVEKGRCYLSCCRNEGSVLR